jgi:hypothetical protein
MFWAWLAIVLVIDLGWHAAHPRPETWEQPPVADERQAPVQPADERQAPVQPIQ